MRVVFGVVVVLMLLLSVPVHALTPPPPLVAGDIDGNGVVDVMDVQLVINGALGLPVSHNTDIDFSGTTDVLDVQLVINVALGISIDGDSDGLCDLAEGNLGTDPFLLDTDGDMYGDGQEMLNGTDPLAPNVSLISLAINKGAVVSDYPAVSLDNVCYGHPTEYMASEFENFHDATWQPYSNTPIFVLSIGDWTKAVYFKVRNAQGESQVVSDTIDLNDLTLRHSGDTQTIMLPGNVPLLMVWVPNGEFLMGSPLTESNRESDEGPQHQVSLTHGFWMGKYEVTKRQWIAVMGTRPWQGLRYVLDDLDSPAIYTTWNDAQAFLSALNTYSMLTFRLPTEAEWEYACRAGTSTRFYWGDDPDFAETAEYAWCWGQGHAEQYAHVVGLKLPNSFGFYDMSGNVWEWCQDWYGDYTSDSVTDPTGPELGTDRVLRGGSAFEGAGAWRSATRCGFVPEGLSAVEGFRVAR